MESSSQINSSTKSPQRGFGLIGAMITALAIITVTLFTVDSVRSGQKVIHRLRVRSNANLAVERLKIMLNSPDVRANLISTKLMPDGTPAHLPEQSQSLTCVLNLKNGGSAPCKDYTRPPSIGGLCSDLPSDQKRQVCWVLNRLESHRASVLFGPDSTKTSPQDLLIDNRSPRGGVDGNLFVCSGFEVAGGDSRCLFRIELFVWVECQGGASLCGGGSGAKGTIYLAAILRPASRLGYLDSGAFSILDVELGTI